MVGKIGVATPRVQDDHLGKWRSRLHSFTIEGRFRMSEVMSTLLKGVKSTPRLKRVFGMPFIDS
jgi:hypothetical protein